MLKEEMPVKIAMFHGATELAVGYGSHSSMVDGNEPGAKIKGLKMSWTIGGLLWEAPSKIKGEPNLCGIIPCAGVKNVVFAKQEPETKPKKAN
jgi:hypothetical protein